MDREEFLSVYRHSLAHILAKAVIEIFGKENVQYAIGPQINDGFYYDFVLPRTVTNEDFKTIEDKMSEIMKRKEDWTRKEVTREEALSIFSGQKFKTELINDLPVDELITVYYTGDDFVDLCRGPHIDNSSLLLSTAFQIKSVSGAYWRGDSERDQLQRIYVYAFPDKKALKEHLALVKEAMERDHKKLGKEMELFYFDETAPGMPYFLPRGWRLLNAILYFWRELHRKHGYQEISGPVLSKKDLWVTSGHWGHYKDNMFLVPMDRENVGDFEDNVYALKPMNCPNAIKVYQLKMRSYADLPLRFNTVDVVHRKEKSGELNGLFRVQMFRQDDSHNFVREDQIGDEIADIMSIANEIYGAFGLKCGMELSTRPDDYMGDLEVWNKAEAALKEILDKTQGAGNYEINEGDGAFYGPKIDLKMTDSLGREWQMGTIQLDFQLPLNFDMKYIDSDGKARRPVMIHRAILGSFERFIGIITENFKASFPYWVAPEQVAVVPIRPENNEYAQKLVDILDKQGVRVVSDMRDINMKEKIKEFKTMRIPYVAVVGNQEAENGTVSLNVRGSNKQLRDVTIEQFKALCCELQESHSIELKEEI
ncbi:MAG: threonine--tRNA ligase [Lachnospiraceae bacterium]|nr:threonine--tRNA ligase [Lachnospiraceae bacterium]